MGIEWTWGPLENYLSRQCCLIRMEMLKHILPQASTNRWNGLMMKLQMKTVNFSLSQSLRQEAFAKIPLHLLQRCPWADKAPILEKKKGPCHVAVLSSGDGGPRQGPTHLQCQFLSQDDLQSANAAAKPGIGRLPFSVLLLRLVRFGNNAGVI